MFVVVSAGFFAMYHASGDAYTGNITSQIRPQYPPAASVQLNVPFSDQDESVNNQYNLPGICWDTSAAMILDYWHNQGYLASVPSQGEIYSATMAYGDGGDLDAALASLGFYSAQFNPQQTFYTSYTDYQQQNNALNAAQMIHTAQVALSLGVPLEATVETQPYPQANVTTGGILCDSRGGNHAVVITGYNQTGFFFNSATNEKFNPKFVTDDSLNTYSYNGRVVNGYQLYCPYTEFTEAYDNQSWCFTAIFPINYAPVLVQSQIQLVNRNGDPIAGMLVSSPFSAATTDSQGYANLTTTYLGAPISIGYNMRTQANDTYSGQYSEASNTQMGLSFTTQMGMYMLYPAISATGQAAAESNQIEYV